VELPEWEEERSGEGTPGSINTVRYIRRTVYACGNLRDSREQATAGRIHQPVDPAGFINGVGYARDYRRGMEYCECSHGSYYLHFPSALFRVDGIACSHAVF